MRRARRVLAHTTLPAVPLALALLLCPPAPARAAPPADGWSLERGDNDQVLNEHRLDALRNDPLSNKYWRSLQKALGDRGRARFIERRRARAPLDPALLILSARIKLHDGAPAEAIKLLSTTTVSESRFAGEVLLLKSSALESLSQYAQAVRVLIKRTPHMREDTRRRYLERAFNLAARHGLTGLGREVGGIWTSEFTTSATAWSSQANAQEASADFAAAAASYARAVEHATQARRRIQWTKDEARALDLADAPQDALAQMTSLFSDRSAVQSFGLEDWTNLLEYARAADELRPLLASLDTAIERLQLHAIWRAYWLRAKVVSALGEPSESHWERAVHKFPREASLMLGWVGALESAGDTEAILEIIETWRRYDEELVTYALGFATRRRVMGDMQTTHSVVARVRRLANPRPTGLRLLRDYFNTHEDFERGLELSKRICALAPNDPVARRRLGDQYMQMNRLADAVAAWNGVARMTRPRNEGWRQVAEIFLNQSGQGKPRQMMEHASRALERGLALAPEDPGLHRIAALLAEHRRDSAAAYAAWDRVLVYSDSDSDANLGLRDEARSRIVENIFRLPKRQRRESLLRQLESDSLERIEHGVLSIRIEAARILAEVYLRQRRTEDVVNVWAGLARAAPQSHEILLSYGRALRLAGRRAGAIQILEELVSRGGDDRATPLLLLAELQVERGDASAAIVRASEAATTVRAPAPLLRIAVNLRQRGDLSMARDALWRAATMFPDHPAPMFELGMLEMTNGDLSAAATSFTASLSKRGDDYIAKRAGAMALSLMSLSDREPEFLSVLSQTSPADSSLASRGLITQTIGFMDDHEVSAWKQAHPDSSAHIERDLLRAFRHDPLLARAMAAQALGRLRAANTSGELVRVATRITTPPTVSRTKRRRLDQLRWEAILAAGTIDDVQTLGPLSEAAATNRNSRVDIAATWALANSDNPEVVAPLARLLEDKDTSELKRALVCVGLARAGLGVHDAHAWELRPLIERVRANARTSTAITACEIANVVYTQDSQVRRLLPLLRSDERALIEIVVWRLGRVAEPADNSAIGETLWQIYLSSSGSLHDVARSAVARFYAERPSPSTAPKLSHDSLPLMATSISRWTRDILHTPGPVSAWSAEAAASAHRHATRALLKLERGPRFERLALVHWNEQCATRSPLHLGYSDLDTEQALLNCLLRGGGSQPRPERTNASPAR